MNFTEAMAAKPIRFSCGQEKDNENDTKRSRKRQVARSRRPFMARRAGSSALPRLSGSDPPGGSSGRRQSGAVRGGRDGASRSCGAARACARGGESCYRLLPSAAPAPTWPAGRSGSGAARRRSARPPPSAPSAEPAGCGPAPRPPGPARGWGKLPAERRPLPPPRLPSGAAPGPVGDYAEMVVPTGGGNKESPPLKPGQWSPGSGPGSGRGGPTRSPGGARAARRAGGGRRGGRAGPAPAGGGLRDAPGPGPLRRPRVDGERLRGEAGRRALPEPYRRPRAGLSRGAGGSGSPRRCPVRVRAGRSTRGSAGVGARGGKERFAAATPPAVRVSNSVRRSR